MLKLYYLLTKPGIILGNLITAAAGFALASRGHFNLSLFLVTIIGLGLVIGSACVLNNYIDRKADAMMERTKNRPLARGIISGKKAILFAIFLGITGFAILALYVNILTALIVLIGFFFYVLLYSFWKYRSSYGTLIGSFAGAVSPVVGYCGAGNQFDLGALLLFIILVFWQMPHFFSIAINHLDEYTAASIPVLPVKKGVAVTKKHMILYIIAFIIATSLLTVFGYAGYIYLLVVLLLGFCWLLLCLAGFKRSNDKLWAHRMFVASLVVLVGFSFTIILLR